MEFVSIENEVAAWMYIEELADKGLEAYPTTLKEDENLLEEDAKYHILNTN